MRHAEPRPATAADATGISECVRAAYTRYVDRIGTAPGSSHPHLTKPLQRNCLRQQQFSASERGIDAVQVISERSKQTSVL